MLPIMGVSTHAQERAVQRLGRNLTRAEWLRVVEDITARRAVLLARDEDLSETYLVHVGARPAKVLWAPLQALVVTVLPDGGLSTTSGRNHL